MTISSKDYGTIIFFCCVGCYILFLLVKKTYLYFKYRRILFIFPKLNSKGIANISMVIAISIAIITLLIVLSSGIFGVLFRVYPSWRANIEGILIKIGGLIFGPIIGLFIGAVTDILTVLLTAGMFHYGYFITALAYGFFAGLIRILIIKSKNKLLPVLILTTIIGTIIAGFIDYYLSFINGGMPFSLTFFTKSLSISVANAIIIVDGVIFSVIITGWILYILYLKKNRFSLLNQRKFLNFKKLFTKTKGLDELNEHFLNWKLKLASKKHQNLYKTSNDDDSYLIYLLPIALILVFVEPIINLLIMPTFDQQLGGGMPLDFWIAVRIICLPLMLVINLVVIYPVYRIVSKIVVYDTTSNIPMNIIK